MNRQRKTVTPEVNSGYVKKLSQMVGCKTVWTREGTYDAEFQRFYAELERLFPTLSARAEKLTFGGGCFVYVIQGRDAKQNLMLMSHHDVVDGSADWATDPFCATERDGWLYGRHHRHQNTAVRPAAGL